MVDSVADGNNEVSSMRMTVFILSRRIKMEFNRLSEVEKLAEVPAIPAATGSMTNFSCSIRKWRYMNDNRKRAN